jgi:hypothetical protein
LSYTPLHRTAAEANLRDVEKRIEMWMLRHVRKHFPSPSPATSLLVAKHYPELYKLLPEALRKEHADAQARLGALEGGGVSQESKLLPEGTKVREKEVPPEYRDGGKPEGAVLTTNYLRDNLDWDFRGPYLSGHYGPDKMLTTHIKVGRKKAYLFKEVAALRTIKTANQAKREERSKRD